MPRRFVVSIVIIIAVALMTTGAVALWPEARNIAAPFVSAPGSTSSVPSGATPSGHARRAPSPAAPGAASHSPPSVVAPGAAAHSVPPVVAPGTAPNSLVPGAKSVVPPGNAVVTGSLKPVMKGLIDRGSEPQVKFRQLVDNWVVDVGWSELQAQPGGPISTNNAIDQAIVAAQQAGMDLKLRVRSGVDAPDWAKRIGGAPISVQDEFNGGSGTIGRFWLPEFGAAYQDLQTKLAARYDSVPQILEVSISRCTTFSAEPMIRQGNSKTTVQALFAAGYSVAADQLCQSQQIDAHKVWVSTRSGLPLNPYQRLSSDGTYQPDEAFSVAMMRHCRDVLGAGCVLENHSIRWPPKPELAYAQLYQDMKAAGPPFSFQTATPGRIGDWQQTLSWAAQFGANSVELNVGYPKYDLSQLHQLGNTLMTNAA